MNDGAWTYKLVRERLIEAVTYARFYGGPVGPSGMRSGMPAYRASLEDHLDEGWGLPEAAEDDEDTARNRAMPRPPSPERIEHLVDALAWPARFVALSNPGSARMLSLWLRCRVYKLDFERALDRIGMSRSHAYRLRDRALTLIAVGLDREGSRP